MKNINKKTASLVIAGVIAFGAVGSNAYAAYNPQWDTWISGAINKLYTAIFPEIKQKTEEKEKQITSQIVSEVGNKVRSTSDELTKHKDTLIQRNQQELDTYYKDAKTQIDTKTDALVKEKKEALTKEADQNLEKSKQAIDTQIQKEWEKMSK